MGASGLGVVHEYVKFDAAHIGAWLKGLTRAPLLQREGDDWVRDWFIFSPVHHLQGLKFAQLLAPPNRPALHDHITKAYNPPPTVHDMIK